jgi:hypothetical protein
VKLGEYNLLKIDRITQPGAYLLDEEGNDVLLPTKYLEGLQVGDDINVFIYKDSEGRIIATTRTPALTVNQFGFLNIAEVNQFGAFAEWGVEKHLLIPFREQPKRLEEGKKYFIYMYIDNATERLVGTTRIGSFMHPADDSIVENQAVDIIAWEYTNLGLKVLVNHRFQGLVFANDIHQKIRIGTTLKGFVKKIREDGKLDIVLLQPGYDKIDGLARKFLALLYENDGFIDLTDKSSPEEIKQQTNWSKKVFKQVVGNLYKQRLIQLHENGISSVEDQH